jgi:hypothetical protein
LSSGKIPSMQHQSFNTIRKRFDSWLVSTLSWPLAQSNQINWS